MKLSKTKQIFLIGMLVLFASVSWLTEIIQTEEMIPWNGESGGQLVTPVSTVAMLRSAQKNASDIQYTEIKNMVTEAVRLAGGLESIIADGDSVILKPNLVGSGGQQPYVNGVTTDYRVVNAVSELVRELNPSGWIGILEGSAPGNNQGTQDMFELYGYNKTNLPLVDDIITLESVDGNDDDFDSPKLVSVSLPDSIALYPDSKKPNKSREIYLTKLYYNADAIITIPVIKNHESAALTVSIKNTSIGMTPPSIYAENNWNIPNLRWEIDHSYPNMHKWLHDFFMCRPTDFTVVDGLQGLQHGPGGGGNVKGNSMNMRLIMAGKDLVATDVICAHLVGLDPAKINYLTYLHNDRAGCGENKLIRVVGNAYVSDVKKKFDHSDARTIAAMTSDFDPPYVDILSASFAGNMLSLSLEADEETEFVEILVDGNRLDQVVVSDFDNIEIACNNLADSDHELTVVAFDQFRNAGFADMTVASVSELASTVPQSFELLPNVPNPFNPETRIRYRLPEAAHVTLTVYSIRGEYIRLLESATKNPGEHSVRWDGMNAIGQPVASGLYFYRMQARSNSEYFVSDGKMTLVR